MGSASFSLASGLEWMSLEDVRYTLRIEGIIVSLSANEPTGISFFLELLSPELLFSTRFLCALELDMLTSMRT